jgi:hypothetical protein
VSDCEQNNGEPASYCQCNLSWLEANIPYSMFARAIRCPKVPGSLRAHYISRMKMIPMSAARGTRT